MKLKILLLVGLGICMFVVIGFASAQLTQNEKTDTLTVEESDNDQCDGLGNCERMGDGDSTGECDGSCNCIEHSNYNRRCGRGDGMGNKGKGPCDGTGYGSGNCCK